MRAELSGIAAEDIDVVIGDGVLTVQAERSERNVDKNHSEIRYGSMSRSVTLPAGTDADDVCQSRSHRRHADRQRGSGRREGGGQARRDPARQLTRTSPSAAGPERACRRPPISRPSHRAPREAAQRRRTASSCSPSSSASSTA
ncbi:hypothetical protein AV521_39900 [Streptomyces sp. IMTB 2501]|uniref:Hsp20/alpha crystallin family protein n=1 Tax=Streptomyces sp. IMTB 2501 TaxID=1776340 RepID=UPI00096F2CAA|nr:hypothetical protein AV521_39900 [Streptomyces sp. IMTB 2501]